MYAPDFYPDRATELLTGLVSTQSLSGHERAASDYLVRQMIDLGFTRAYVDESDSAVGIIEPPESNDPIQAILFLGHIDTVPGAIPVERRGDLLFGRGTVDAKGPLATFTAGAALAGSIPGWRIIVVGATEEEAASSRGARYQLTQWQPDLVVIGEPSQWERMTLGYKGRLLADLVLKRPLSHTAGKQISAAEHAVEYWNAVKRYANDYNTNHDKVFDQILPSLRHIQTSDDGITESVHLTIGLRLPLDAPPEVLKPFFQSSLPPRDGDDPIESILTFRGEEVAHRAEKNTSIVRLFNNAIRDEGGKPGFVYKTGTSDMNVVAPVWKVPILAYGPGDSALDHTPDEHISLTEYHRAIRVVAGVIRQLAPQNSGK